jgi:type 1 glutamine amidotransferase
MQRLLHLLAATCLAAAAPAAETARENAPAKPAPPVRVLILTGGHGFEQEPFFRMFQDDSGLAFHAAAHPHAQAQWKRAAEFDTMVLYDMWQPIADEAKADFRAWLAAGKGLVVLHHALASYQDWPDYAAIAGGKYLLKPESAHGFDWPASTYRHDVEFTVRIAARDHPVTRGLEDFRILDETYHALRVAPDTTTLLVTGEPTSHPVVGWTRNEGKARVACIQGGHDRHAFDHPSFRRLLGQAIRWTAGRE